MIVKLKDLGFEASFVYGKPYKYSTKEDLRWILWLTEVRFWLIDKYNLNINIKHRTHSQTYCFNITSGYQDGENGELYSELYTKFTKHEKALEKAIKEALDLIKLN